MAGDFPAGTWREDLVTQIFSSWSGMVPDAALAAWKQLPESAASGRFYFIWVSRSLRRQLD